MSTAQQFSRPGEGVLTFGPCALNLASAQLTRDGRVVPLTPKAYDVLRYLVEHAGRLVTKQELLDAVLAGRLRRRRRAEGVHPRDPQGARRRGPEAAVHRDRAPARLSVHRGRRRCRPTCRPRHPRPPRPLHPHARSTFRATHYAHSGDVNIAYQVLGDGPVDLVFVMGWVSHLECFWTEPSFARFLRRLSEFARVILFDKRGTGLSDRVGALPTLEQRMDDVRAVMAAAGSRRGGAAGRVRGRADVQPVRDDLSGTDARADHGRHLRQADVVARLSRGPRTPRRASASSTRSARTGAGRWASRHGRRAAPRIPSSASGGATTCARAPAPAPRSR